jgi:hypothetical protein
MAVRVEELQGHQVSGRVYRFPTARIRRRNRLRVVRRRIALATLLVAFIVAFMLATGPSGVAPASVSHAPRGVVVHAGQTLWDVARRYARPGTDPRGYVQSILDLNHLSAPPAAGTHIRLPR